MEKDYDASINDRIASETKTLHDRNNKIASLKMVMALRSAQYWREYVRTFYWLFLTFEDECRKIRENGPENLRAAFNAVHDPLLLRTAKIRQDLSFYFDGDQSILKECTSATAKSYMTHIRTIANEQPVRLMAYLSVMYLGLFAGGQIIKSKIIKRTGFYPAKAGLSHAEVIELGTNIFTFDTDDTTALKKTHRARFDRVCYEYLTPAERDEICLEAREIFIRNEDMIASVEVPRTELLLLQFLKIPILIFISIALLLSVYVYHRN